MKDEGSLFLDRFKHEKLIKESKMKVIRENIFETNSSSTHSLALSLKPLNEWSKKLHLDKDNNLIINFRDFEGYCEHISNIEDKIAFLLELSMHGLGYYYFKDTSLKDISDFDLEEFKETLYDLPLFHQIEETLKKHCPVLDYLAVEDIRGHIDHQTTSDYYSGEEFLEDFNISLEDYLFKDIVLLADHD